MTASPCGDEMQHFLVSATWRKYVFNFCVYVLLFCGELANSTSNAGGAFLFLRKKKERFAQKA